ncbi:MAG: anti-sigma B factor antagonist [Synechococcus sp. EAC657]|nr:anti-sigma B factor antagonist [Synechococcus sp. EAC657]|tara:strand:- start:7929 stop:8255 length:327 start_codon:yes stop_codon:yes gene_type:complete
MDVQSSTFKNWQVIKVSGQIDSKTVIKLRDFIDSELKPDQPVALELTDVPFMSSAGLRTLLTLQRKTKELNISLALIGLGDGIADTMKVTGFYQFFTIYESLDAIPGV